MALCGAEGLCLAELVPEGGALSVKQSTRRATVNHAAILPFSLKAEMF